MHVDRAFARNLKSKNYLPSNFIQSRSSQQTENLEDLFYQKLSNKENLIGRLKQITNKDKLGLSIKKRYMQDNVHLLLYIASSNDLIGELKIAQSPLMRL